MALQLFAGQLDGTLCKLQLRVRHLDIDIAEVGCTLSHQHFGLQRLQRQARALVNCMTLGDGCHNAVAPSAADVSLQLSHDVEMSHVEEAALRLAGILTWQVVVGHEVYVASLYPMVAAAFYDIQMADTEAVVHIPLLGMADPRTLHIGDGGRYLFVVSHPVHHVLQGICLVVKRHVNVAHRQLAQVERQLLLLRFHAVFSLWLGSRHGVLLEGIDDELVVGCRVGSWLVELRPDTVYGGIGDAHLVAEQRQQPHIDRQTVELEHLTMLQVLDIQTVEVDVL